VPMVCVRQRDGSPLAGCVVTLIGNSDYNSRRCVRTGSDGTAPLPLLDSGSHYVFAQPPLTSSSPPWFGRIEVAPGANEVVVDFREQAERLVQVVAADGSPCRGVTIDVCDVFVGEATDRTHILPWQMLFDRMQGQGLAAYSVATDERGEVLVHGPRDRAVALRVHGGGVAAETQWPVFCGQNEPLRIVGAVSATLRGKVEPAAAIAAARRLGIWPERLGKESREQEPLHLELRQDARVIPGAEWQVAPFTVADDGSFAISGLPPGRFEVGLRYMVVQSFGTVTTGSQENLPLGVVDLHANATTDVRFDAQALLPGTLAGTVRQNGRPWADARVTIQTARQAGGPRVQRVATTDADGRFVLSLPAGEYRVRPTSGGAFATGVAIVAREQTVAAEFTFAAGTLSLRLLCDDGTPAVNCLLRCVPTAQGAADLVVQTDAVGRVTADLLPGSYTLREASRPAVPSGLASPPALGEFSVMLDRTTDLELRLPPLQHR
jgi:hypothetical protein